MAGKTNKGDKGYNSRRGFLKASAVAAVGLSGCTGGGGGQETESPSGQTSPQQTTVGGGGSEQKTITFMSAVDSYTGYRKARKKLIKKFEKENPNITVDYTVVGFADFFSKVTQAAAGGEPIDVMDVPAETNLWNLQQQDLLQPVSDIVQDLGKGYWYERMLSFGRGPDEQWGIPFRHSVNVQWARKDLWNDLGFSFPEGIDAPTWDKYLDVVSTIDEETEYAGATIALSNSYFISTYGWNLFLNNDAHMVNPDHEIVFDSQETREFLKYFEKLSQYAPKGHGGYGAGDLRNVFLEQQVAHTFYSSFLLPTDIENQNPDLKGKADIFPAPVPSKDHNPNARAAGEWFAVSRGIEHPEAAKKFIKFSIRPENLIPWMHGTPASGVVTVKPIFEDHREKLLEPEIYSKYEDIYEKYQKIARNYMIPVVFENGQGILTPETATIMGDLVFLKSMQEVVLQDKPIDDTVVKFAKQMQDYV